MIDNYVNSTETLSLYIYDAGNRVSADATPTVVAEDADTGDAVTMAGVTVVPSGQGYNYYTTHIAPSEVTTTRQVIVTWSYVYDGNNYNRVETVNVVRPYFEPTALWDRYPQFASGGAEFQTYDQLQNIERRVRFIINTYCNQRFQDFGRKTKKVRGSGSNALQLPERIYYLESLTSDSLVLFERDGGGAITTETATWNEDEPHIIIKKGSESPSVTFRDKDPFVEVVDRTKALFRSDRLYSVEADYGWKYLPQEVTEAAVLLGYEALQMEDRYRQKNVTVLRSADYRMEFGSDHHTSTGSVEADHMLSDYVYTGVHVF